VNPCRALSPFGTFEFMPLTEMDKEHE